MVDGRFMGTRGSKDGGARSGRGGTLEPVKMEAMGEGKRARQPQAPARASVRAAKSENKRLVYFFIFSPSKIMCSQKYSLPVEIAFPMHTYCTSALLFLVLKYLYTT